MSESLGQKIGAVAEELGVKTPTLRVWCDHGLVETYRGARNARYIFEDEKEKIEKLKKIMDRSPKPTYEEAKEELVKENFWRDHQEEASSNEMVSAVGTALEKQGVLESFQVVAQAMETLKEDTVSKQEFESFKQELSNSIESQLSLLNSGEEKKEREHLSLQQQETQKEMKRVLEEVERRNNDIVRKKERENIELRAEISDMKDKLDKAVNYIQDQEDQQVQDKQKKTVWQRIFGKNN